MSLHFKITGDNTDLRKSLRESGDAIKNTGNIAEREGNRIHQSFKRIGAAAAGAFSVAALSSFAKEIVNVRGEMQMLESSFDVLLKGKDVTKFLGELKSFAVESPLSLTGVSNAAQTLLGFNVAAEKVIPTIKQLGDISMGNEQRFQSLTLAFAQMSSVGKLMGQDLLQMINAGFNPLQEISAKTGKSIGELKKDMESGAISSEMVTEAFRSATEAGGQFYGMTEKQAEGIEGLKAQLEGGLQDAFNDIGKSQEGIITGGYKAAISLVENYDKVGEALMMIVATYGTYKAALMLVGALERANMMTMRQAVLEKHRAAKANVILTSSEAFQIASKKLLTLHTQNLTRAIRAQAVSMATNPAILLTAAIVGLGYATYKLATYQTEATKAQERLKKAAGEADAEFVKEERSLDSLNRRLQEAEKGTDSYKKVKEEIVKQYGKYFAGLDQEIERVGNLSTVYDTLSESIRRSAAERKYDDLVKQEEDYVNDKISETLQKARKALIDRYKDGYGGELYSEFYDYVVRGVEKSSDVWKKWSNTAVGLNKNVSLLAHDLNKVKEASSSALNDFKNIHQISGGEGDFVLWLPDDGLKEAEKRNEEFWKKQKETAEKAISDIDSALLEKLKLGKTEGIDSSIVDSYKKATKDIAEADKSLSLYKPFFDRPANKEFSDRKQIASELLKIRQDNEQREIDLLEEGAEKRLKQLDLNLKRELDKIEEYRKLWKDKLGDLTPEQEGVLSLWAEMANATFNLGKSDIENEGINKAEKEIQSLLEKYQDFNARKLAIDKEYQDDLAKLESQATSPERDAAINELKKRWKEALSSLNLEEFQDSLDWSVIFGDLDKVTTKELDRISGILKQYIDDKGDKLSPIDLKTVMDALDEMELKKANRQPITELKKGHEEYKKSVEDVTKAKKELAKYEKQTPEYIEAQKKLNAEENKRFAALSKMTKAVNEMGRMGGDIVNAGNEVVDMLSSFGVSISESVAKTLDGIGQIMSGLEKINLNEPFSVVTGSITALTGIGKAIGGLFGLGKNKDDKLFKQIEGYEKLVSLYDQLIDKQKEYLRNLTGGDLLKQVSETEDLIRRKEEAEKNKLQKWFKTGASSNHHSMGYRINRDMKKELKAMGIDDIYEALSFDAEKWKDVQKNIEVWEKLPEEVRNYAQAVIDAKSDTESLAEAIKEITTQTTFEGLRDGFKSTLLDMKSDAKSLANDLEKIMQEAMINSILDEEFNDWLKDWRNKLNDSMISGGGIDKDEYKELQEEWQRQLEKKLAERDAMMDMFGWGKNEHSQDTSRGYSTTMDQETGGAVLGMTRGIFESLEQSRAIMLETSMNTSEINSTLKGFTSGFNDLLDLNIQQTFYQAEIAKLSKALPLIEKTLGKIEKHTSKL